MEELKIASKLANMCDERKDSNSEEDDEPIQTTRKHGQSRPKKVNTRKLILNLSKQGFLKSTNNGLLWNVNGLVNYKSLNMMLINLIIELQCLAGVVFVYFFHLYIYLVFS